MWLERAVEYYLLPAEKREDFRAKYEGKAFDLALERVKGYDWESRMMNVEIRQ